MLRTPLAACLLLVLPLVAAAEPPPAIRTITVDEHTALTERPPLAELGDRQLHQRGPVHQILFSPDGRRLATTGTNDETGVYLWEVESGELIASLESDLQPRAWYDAIAFTPDGEYLLGGNVSGGFDLWEVVTAKHLFSEQRHKHGIKAIATSLDGRTFATVGGDGLLKVSRIDEPEEVIWQKELEKRGAAPGAAFAGGIVGDERCSFSGLYFAPDKKTLIAGYSGQKGIVLLNAETGDTLREIPIKTSKGTSRLDGGVTSIAITPDGHRLVVGGHRKMLREDVPEEAAIFSKNIQITEAKLWNLDTGEVLRDLTRDQWNVGNGVVALSKDGKRLALAHYGKVQVISAENGREIRSFPVPGWPGQSIGISPDGFFVAAADGHTIALFNVESGRRQCIDLPVHRSSVASVLALPGFEFRDDVKRRLLERGGHEKSVTELASPILVTAGYDGRVHFWNGKTQEHVRGDWLGPETSIHDAAVSPDGKTLAVGGTVQNRRGEGHGILAIWHLESHQRYTITFPHPVMKVAIAEDGRIAVSQSSDTRLEIWEFQHGYRRVADYPKDPRMGLSNISALRFSADGRYLNIAVRDGRVIRWDTIGTDQDVTFRADWRRYVPAEQRQKNLQIGASAFTPDAQRLVTTTNNAIFVWEVTTQKAEAKFELPQVKHGFQIAVSPDGSLLAATSRIYNRETGVNPIWVFDLKTFEPVFQFTLAEEHAISLAFSADAQTLLTGLSRGTTLVWDVRR